MSAITTLSIAASAFCDMPANGEVEAIYALQAARQMVESCTLMEVSTRLCVLEALDNEIGRCEMDRREADDARNLQRDLRDNGCAYQSESIELDALYRAGL